MWSKLKRQMWEWRGVLVTAPSVAAIVILLRFAGLLQLLEWSAYDRLFRLPPQEEPDERIAIVGISEDDIRQNGWPIPDRVLANLLQKIKAQNPRAIGLDLYRDLPVEPGHQELVEVYNSTPNLIGIKKLVGGTSGPAVNAPPELQAKGQVSVNDTPLDSDSKIRRHFLYVSQGEETIESLGLKLAYIYLEKEGVMPKPAQINPDYLQLGEAVFVPFASNDGGYVRTDARGYQILLNYRGPAGSFRTVSMGDILADKIPADLIRDRIVLIGSTAESLNDLFDTPYSSNLIGVPKRVPGVEVHANLTSAILSAALENRPLLRSWPEWVEGLWIFGASCLGAVSIWQGRYNKGVAKISLKRAGVMLLAGGSFVLVGYLAFLQGWWIPVIPPVLALAGSAIAITAYIARSAGEIRQTFSRYLTDEVVAKLLESPEGLKLGGDRRKVTILMSDLRGFSAVSERLPPETVVSMLNIYLGAMADEIVKYQGTIDEFIGDAILVLFGAPTQREDDAERAVACALAMQLAMDGVNQKNERLGLPKIEMGIGLNTGEVVVGNIGSDKRAKYGVVGSHVNLTARIESYTVGGQILISEATLKDVGDLLQIEGEMQVQPKGFNEPMSIYEVGGIGGKYNLHLRKEENILVPLTEEFPVRYTVLEGKNIDGIMYPGSLVKLSAKGAEIISEHTLEPLKNIKLNLITGGEEKLASGDVYGKVLKKSKDGDNNYYIGFTNIAPDAAKILNDIHDKNGTGK